MLNKASAALAAIVVLSVSAVSAADVSIEIRSDGQYVQTVPPNPSGKQRNVVVVVGEKIEWVNKASVPHTATSDLKLRDASGAIRFLFDTEQIPGDDNNPSTPSASKEVELTADHYDQARQALGIDDGDLVHLGYYCANHPDTMGGKIVLVKTEALKRKILDAAKTH